jgi:hypothetical protein
MSDQGPVIVPVEVSAFVLNSPAMNVLRAGMNYDALNTLQDPAPGAFANAEGNFSADPANQGVYVLWTLPKGLRRQQDGEFPPVPNRWLVVRSYCPQATPGAAPVVTSWVVQSDFMDPQNGSSAYIDPTVTSQITPTLIGRRVAITGSTPWQEPVQPPAFVLRAVAEANPAFAAFQAFNQNVFSIFDDLQTLGVAAGTLSYYVVGWYSVDSNDVLANWVAGAIGNDFTDVLARLNWAIDTGSGQISRTSIYQGSACGAVWSPGGPIPPSPKDDVQPDVALGNSSIDAFVAFARAAFEQSSAASDGLTPQEAADLINAFEYNLLPMFGQPGSEAMFEQTLRAQWFGSSQVGTTWVIADAERSPDQPPPVVDPNELAFEAQWLATLNAAQASYDQDNRDLIDAQRTLFALWWKYNTAQIYSYESNDGNFPWNTTDGQFTSAISAATADVQRLQGLLAGLAPLLPLAGDTITLAEAIAAFAGTKNLPATRLLKAQAQPRFWLQNDPVMVLSNTAGMLQLDPTGALACRWTGSLVQSLQLSGGSDGPNFPCSAAQLAGSLPTVPFANLPALAQDLFAELFLLDPANAPHLAAAAGQTLSVAQLAAVAAGMSPPIIAAGDGTAPAVLAGWPWQQPWMPLFLDWEVEWYPIPFQAAAGDPNWAFDGLDYDLVAGKTFSPGGQLIDGRTVLTPKPAFEFKARVDQFIADYPDNPLTAVLQAMENLVGTVEGWGFLSQSLGGLNALLAGWNPVAVPQPGNPAFSAADVASLIGEQVEFPPNPMLADRPRDPNPPPSIFEGLRGGQLLVNRVTIVDAFGQTLEVVESPGPNGQFARTFGNQVFHPLTADGLTPSAPLSTIEPLRFVQLPPRLLQTARVNLDFNAEANGSAIIGWLLPDHLDSGISAYGPDGTAYGTLRLGVAAGGAPNVAWDPAPYSPWQTLPLPSAQLPDFQNALATLQSLGPGALADLLQSVDETLWTVDPLGGRSDAFLSLLIGRPIAVVAATLSLELQRDPLRDTAWPYTFTDPDPLFLDYTFPVRLGDLGYRQDGLLGYFAGGDFTHFDSIHVPARGPKDPPLTGYLQAIAPDNYINLGFAEDGPGTPEKLVMLMDPRASVHVQCGILPVKQATLPSAWVDGALAAMIATFRTGPSLVSQQAVIPASQGDPATALLMPRFAEQSGTLTWLEADGQGGWTELALARVDGAARLPATAPTLREGLMKLSGGADQ